ncbi:MAG: alpha/beta fold hydrolase [Candidatus Thorarchaeota archaeon]
MLYAIIKGLKLSYIIQGNGFPIIFIHGYGGDKEFWKPQIVELSKFYKTIAFDLRGTGESDRPNIPYTMNMLVDDIKGLMDFLKLSKAHIIGRSFGGMIAQNFVIKYPNQVDKLILIATNYGKPTTDWVDLIRENNLKNLKLLNEDPYQAFKQQARLVYHVNFRKEMEQNPRKKFFNLFSMEDLIKKSTINPPREQDVINQAEAMKTHYTLDKLSEISTPTLLIAASHDRLIPLSIMEEIHDLLPNSILRVIENSGHYMTLSDAPEVNKVILNFLRN